MARPDSARRRRGRVRGALARRASAGPAARPYIGELCGAEAVLLFSCSLVLAGLVPFGERWLGGFDRVIVWRVDNLGVEASVIPRIGQKQPEFATFCDWRITSPEAWSETLCGRRPRPPDE